MCRRSTLFAAGFGGIDCLTGSPGLAGRALEYLSQVRVLAAAEHKFEDQDRGACADRTRKPGQLTYSDITISNMDGIIPDTIEL